MPNALADRAMAPRFSGSLSPSSTAIRDGAGDGLGDGRQRPALGDGDGAAVQVEADRRRQDVTRGDVDRGVDAVELAAEAGERLRRDEHRADPVTRRQQPADRRHALGDEQLVALDAPPGRRVGQLDVVGEPRIACLDGHQHATQSRRLDRAARDRATIEHMSDLCTCRVRCSGSTSPAVDGTFGGLRRTHLDDHSWIDHAPGWLHGEQAVFDQLWHELTGSSARSRCGSAVSPSRG